jgi:spore coat protein H
VLRDRGVPAARAAFYRVFVDAGEGTTYWGLYTMVEDPADGAMLDAQLGGRGANLYKPDGPAANWSRFDPASFEKKTNERAADFRDVMAAIDALHSETTDRRAWRTGIERVFDVDLFLRWLAVNTAIGNWDAYGAMPHNMAFGAGPGFGRGFPGRGALPDVPPPFARGGGRGRGGPFGRATQDVLHRDVGAEWPLISRLLADPDYATRYRTFLRDAVAGLMAPDAVAQRVRTLHELIAPAIDADAAFRDSAASLLGEITRQRERIHAALAESAR